MVQTSCRKRKNVQEQIRVIASVEGRWGIHGLLTLDIQVHVSGKWAGLCSTRCRATSPWNASSYNRRFYIVDASHALNSKHRRKENISNLALQTRALAPSNQQKPTLHGVFHILCKHIPHHLCTDLAHIQFLWKPARNKTDINLILQVNIVWLM